jgi:hypothetical protein
MDMAARPIEYQPHPGERSMSESKPISISEAERWLEEKLTRKLETYLRSPEASSIVRQSIREVASEAGATPADSGEAAGMIRLLAARSGDNREDVLLKALTLYGLALDAIEKGNHLAILTPEDEIVREITGFQPAEVAGDPAGR